MKQAQNRMADTATRTTAAATVVEMPDFVLPHLCPLCGRGQVPKVRGRRPNGDRRVSCTLCGGEYVYIPAKTRQANG